MSTLKKTVAANLVACSGVSRERVGEGIDGAGTILEDANDRVPARIGGLESPSVHASGQEGVASQLPVGRPLEAIEHIEGEATGHSEQA